MLSYTNALTFTIILGHPVVFLKNYLSAVDNTSESTTNAFVNNGYTYYISWWWWGGIGWLGEIVVVGGGAEIQLRGNKIYGRGILV